MTLPLYLSISVLLEFSHHKLVYLKIIFKLDISQKAEKSNED